METTIFDAPLREFKTFKAASEFAKRINAVTEIKKATKSAFDFLHPEGKPIYQIFIIN